ncbi:MAG TPA: hypothetical protein EYQ74_05360 [Planctomycetes bacterium]|nr:hypothetical protein [Planctomycetota bacterium]HIK61441.1 hypothetical protein [Planctomycetota bacterium]
MRKDVDSSFRDREETSVIVENLDLAIMVRTSRGLKPLIWPSFTSDLDASEVPLWKGHIQRSDDCVMGNNGLAG